MSQSGYYSVIGMVLPSPGYIGLELGCLCLLAAVLPVILGSEVLLEFIDFFVFIKETRVAKTFYY